MKHIPSQRELEELHRFLDEATIAIGEFVEARVLRNEEYMDRAIDGVTEKLGEAKLLIRDWQLP